MKFLFTVLCFAAIVATAQTNSPYRRVDGVIYNPALSVKWKSIPEINQHYTVVHVRTNGVIFALDVTLMDGSSRSDGYVFVKNCPGSDAMYNDQVFTFLSFRALPIPNLQMPTKDGGFIQMRAFDCGEPCNLPTKKP
jgi:hypothetical protein